MPNDTESDELLSAESDRGAVVRKPRSLPELLEAFDSEKHGGEVYSEARPVGAEFGGPSKD